MASAPKVPLSGVSALASVAQAETTLLASLRLAFCCESPPLVELKDASADLSPPSILVGLSGGLDSSLLLRLLCDLRDSGELTIPLRAIHVNHGLQEAADRWQAHCETLCTEWGVNLTACLVDCSQDSAGVKTQHVGRQSAVVSEEAARRARYAGFEAALCAGERLALGHHQDDQLETLLLRLARGAGIDGLAGMPRERALGAGTLIRPWLEIPRRSLEDVAFSRGLFFVEDSSNQNTVYDRNLLRAQVLPLIESRWPGYRQSWGKSQRLMRDSHELNTDLAEIDLKACLVKGARRLRVAELALLSSARRRNLLRHWLLSLGCSVPSWNLLSRLDSEVYVRADQSAQWHCGAYSLYRFKGELAAVLADSFEPQDVLVKYTLSAEEARIELPNNGMLEVSWEGEVSLGDSSFTLRYRQGGECLCLPGRPSKPLKKILNEEGVAPWLRGRLPLVLCGDEILWVALIGPSSKVAKNTVANADGRRLSATFKWLPPALELSR